MAIWVTIPSLPTTDLSLYNIFCVYLNSLLILSSNCADNIDLQTFLKTNAITCINDVNPTKETKGILW